MDLAPSYEREGAGVAASLPGSPDALCGESGRQLFCSPVSIHLRSPRSSPCLLSLSQADTLADKRQLLSVAASSERFLDGSTDFQCVGGGVF
jgi:hypothetical protein